MPCGWEGNRIGLASHWPCVTDNSGITTYGLMALGTEMSTPPIPSRSVAQFTNLPYPRIYAHGVVYVTVLFQLWFFSFSLSCDLSVSVTVMYFFSVSVSVTVVIFQLQLQLLFFSFYFYFS